VEGTAAAPRTGEAALVLCGIARRLTANTRRREGREPVCAAEELEDEHHAAGPGPAEQTISARRRRFCGARWSKFRRRIASR